MAKPRSLPIALINNRQLRIYSEFYGNCKNINFRQITCNIPTFFTIEVFTLTVQYIHNMQRNDICCVIYKMHAQTTDTCCF